MDDWKYHHEVIDMTIILNLLLHITINQQEVVVTIGDVYIMNLETQELWESKQIMVAAQGSTILINIGHHQLNIMRKRKSHHIQ